MATVCHENQLVLVLVRFQKPHQARVVDSVVEIRVDAPVLVQVPKSIVVGFFDIEEFAIEFPFDFRVFQEKDGVVELG